MRRRVLIVVLGVALCLAPVAWVVVQASGEWRLQAELRQAERAFGARRFGEARSTLSRLSEGWPGRGEVEYWLGVCEQAEGHPDAALAAWGRVPDAASEAPASGPAPGQARPRARSSRHRRGEPGTRLAPARRPGRRGAGPVDPGLLAIGPARGCASPDAGEVFPIAGTSRGAPGPLADGWRRSRARELAGSWRRRDASPRRRPRLARPGGPGDPVGEARRGRRLADALRGATAGRHGGLARPARLGAGRRPARRSRASGDAPARLPLFEGAGPRAPGLARRAGGEPDGRAIGPGGAARPGAGRRRGPGAPGRTRRGGRRRRPRRRAAPPEGHGRRRARPIPGAMSEPDPSARAADLARTAEALGRRFDARSLWAYATRRDPSTEPEARAASPGWRQPARPSSPPAGPSPTSSSRSGRRGDGGSGTRPRGPRTSPGSPMRPGGGASNSRSRTGGPTSSNSPKR